MHEWSIKNIAWTWETIKTYLQIVGILLALEGYILAEYTLPLLGNGDYWSAAGSVLVCWFLTLVMIREEFRRELARRILKHTPGPGDGAGQRGCRGSYARKRRRRSLAGLPLF